MSWDNVGYPGLNWERLGHLGMAWDEVKESGVGQVRLGYALINYWDICYHNLGYI
jgi:hypothetical protein